MKALIRMGMPPVPATSESKPLRAKMPNIRKYRRTTSITSTTAEVSGCLKYLIFGFNVVCWLLGLGILSIGIWAWTEKDIFSNLEKTSGNIALDPAFILICTGTATFVIGFTGCVGALRENTCLLATYAIILTALLIFEMTIGVMGFIFRDWVKSQATSGFQAFIIHYREDPDQQNLIDWIQEDWLQCCGIEGPKDWDRNNYFNCSSREIGSSEACGVPFSCCKSKPNEIIKNKQCGYGVRMPGFSGDRDIHERGCLRAGEEWMESHLVTVASVGVGLLILQQEPNSPNSFDLSKEINERGCLEALEEWTEKHMIYIASYCFIILFLQFFFQIMPTSNQIRHI